MFHLRVKLLAKNNLSFVNRFGSKTRLKFTLRDEFKTHSSEDILETSKQIKSQIESVSSTLGRSPRVGILCSNNYTYLTSIIGSFLSNATAIPLNRSHPKSLLDYYVNDSNCDILIKNEDVAYSTTNPNTSEIVLNDKRLFLVDNSNEKASDLKDNLQFKNNHNDALILYTSGTSSRPKGVVMTYYNLHASIENLTHCWRLNSQDVLLNALPLNHVHGLVYCLLAPLLIDAECVLLPRFNPKLVWENILNGKVNIFSGVPTMYYKLLEEAETMNEKGRIKEKLSGFKLFASASAPLSQRLSDRWFDLTGFRLIDRYGLSESSGLVFANSLDANVSGSVGRPGFNFRTRIVSQKGKILIESSHDNDSIFVWDKKNILGDLEIKGPGVFRCYLNNAQLTSDSFTYDGWFKTGDTAQYRADSRTFKIVGRTSVDVIKSGGFRVSALEIESRILEHELVQDAVVIGLDDEKWGQIVMALLVVKDGFDKDRFLNWCGETLNKPSVPKIVECVSHIERNQMGKVDKKSLVRKYSSINK